MAGMIQVNGTRGELSPLLHARIDIDHYQAGFARALNWVMMRYGGWTRFPGSIYMGARRVADGRGRWLPFKFNVEQVYAIEVTEGAFRFWTSEGQVMDGGSPYEVTNDYNENHLPKMRFRQIGDVVYITAPNRPVRKLTRRGETDWTLTDYVAQDGPYMPINTTATTLTPAETGAVHPLMTANNAPAGTMTAEFSVASAYRVFDRDYREAYADDSNTGWLRYEFDVGVTKVVDAYWIKASSSSEMRGTPASWRFQGFDGTNWVTLDQQQGQTGWGRGEVRFFEFDNKTAFEAYRLIWDGTDFPSGEADSRIAEMGWHERGQGQTPFNLVASGTEGINDDVGYRNTDVGRSIRLRGGDGRWRWARITERVSATTVKIRLFGHALSDLEPIQSWRLGLWHDDPSYPVAIGVYEDRLVLGGDAEDPFGGHASVSADYDNFAVSSPLVDDDSVFRVTGGELNQMNWIADGEDILIGTEGAIRSVGRNDQGRAFGPENIRQRRGTKITTSYIEPIEIENMFVMLDGYRTRLYEVGYSDEVQGYLPRELSALNEHLLGLGVISYAYQDSPHKIIWAVTEDGTLLACTYDRNEKVFGVSECKLGGDAFVEAVLTLPSLSLDGDTVFFMVRRTIDGETVRYVEKLSAFYREGYSEQDYPIYGHCAGVYEGLATNTVTGLEYLANETVGVYADGRDVGDVTVDEDGLLTLPLDIEAELIVWGIRYNSLTRTLRLASLGPQAGPQLGQRVNLVRGLVDIYQTPHLEVGTPVGEWPLRIEADQELDPFGPATLHTGSFHFNLDDSWENNGVCVMSTNKMYPATVLALTVFPEGEP
jgi:hypothetical protein